MTPKAIPSLLLPLEGERVGGREGREQRQEGGKKRGRGGRAFLLEKLWRRGVRNKKEKKREREKPSSKSRSSCSLEGSLCSLLRKLWF